MKLIVSGESVSLFYLTSISSPQSLAMFLFISFRRCTFFVWRCSCRRRSRYLFFADFSFSVALSFGCWCLLCFRLSRMFFSFDFLFFRCHLRLIRPCFLLVLFSHPSLETLFQLDHP